MDRTQQLIDCLQRWDEEDQAGRRASPSSVCGERTDLIPELVALSDFRGRLERLLGTLDGLETLPPSGDTVAPTGLPAIPGYAVSRMLAEGGMGQVYFARDLRFERDVALKVIRPDRVSADLLARFRTEALAIAKLDDPNIVHIYAVDEYDEPGAKVPFLALEFVPGGTLESRAGISPMPPAEAARVVRILARAMAHAHARGIVHRDLKPDNVLIAPPSGEPSLNAALGRPKITDFGLARRDLGGSSVTRPGSIMGTPSYMAPEQAAGAPAGPPADVYALGAILYRLLTGRVVFPRAAWVDALHDVRHEPPQPPGELVPGIPPALESLCLRCLDKDADMRPTAAELAAELERASVADPLPPTELFRPTTAPRPRRRVVIGAAILALVLAVAMFVWRLTRGIVIRFSLEIKFALGSKHQQPSAQPMLVTGVLLMIAFTGGIMVWRSYHSMLPPAVDTSDDALGIQEPLKGYLDAEMRREGDRLREQFIPLSDPAARPLRPRDQIRVSVALNRPAYVYIVWIDTEGTVSPQYPWIDHDWTRRRPEGKAAKFELPQFEGAWGAWTMGPGEPGLETMVLLCREEPLPEGVDLAGMLRGLGKVPLDGQDASAVSWFENGKTVRGEKQRAPLAKAVEGGNPLERINREIHRRVRDHFDYTRTITYGNTGGK